MIRSDAMLSIQRIPIEHLIVQEAKPRYASMVMLYVEQLRAYPHDDAGMIRVVPSQRHPGMFVVDDGHHRLCAYIIAGRKDMLCIIVQEQATAAENRRQTV